MQEHKISFSKGMNRDISKNKFPEGYYSYLLNGRIISAEGSDSYDIKNLRGTMNALIYDSLITPPTDRDGFEIIGYTILRNDIVLFFAENNTTTDNYLTESCIDVLEYQGNDIYHRREIWRGVGMNFRIDKPIEATSRYENDNLQKIYWCDNNENLRTVNISNDVSGYTMIQFDLVGVFPINENSAPKFKAYISGRKKQGVNHYAYRLVKKHGQTTPYSPLSEPMPIANKINATSSASLKGDDIYDPDSDYNANIGIQIELDDTGIASIIDFYDYIEVVSLWYSSKNGVPDISVIYKGPFKKIIIDDGVQSYGTLDYGVFLSQQQDFSAKTLTIKDNRLFTGNIKEKFFDIDEVNGGYWDARAYRFDDNQLCELLESDFTTAENTLNGAAPNYASIAYDSDCVNIFNKITPDKSDELNGSGNQQKFQSNGSTPGGEGLNIKYRFYNTTTSLRNSGVSEPANKNSGIFMNDSDFKLHIGQKRVHQKDEVYRYGIVGYDTKGRESFAKWIGDIRTPGIWEFPLTDSNFGHGTIIEFTVQNLPLIDGVPMRFKIVRLPRTDADKTVLLSGLASPLLFQPDDRVSGSRVFLGYKMISLRQWSAAVPIVLTTALKESPGQLENSFFGNWTDLVGVHPTTIELRSPELTFTKNNYNVEYVEVAGINNHYESKIYNKLTLIGDNYGWHDEYQGANSTGPKKNFAVNKYSGVTSPISTHPIYRRTRVVFDHDIINQPPGIDNEVSVGNININYSAKWRELDGDKHDVFRGIGTRGMLLNVSPPLVQVGELSEPNNMTSMHLYARQDVHLTQYGGAGYEDRSQNVYISASNIGEEDSPGVYIATADQVDTFIDAVTNRRLSSEAKGGSYDDDGEFIAADQDKHGLSDDIVYDCQSTINVNLKHNDDYFDIRNFPLEESVATIMREDGTTDGDTGIIINALGQYNSVYSRENDTKKFFVKPLLFEQVENFNELVKYSNVKINNEDYDNWLTFRPNNSYGLETTHGSLNKLVEFSDIIYSFQDSGFAMLNINPNAVVSSTAGEVSLGTGNVIQDVKYITTDVGCQDNSDVLKSKSAMYWLCKNNKKIYTFNGSLQSVSDIKGLHSYFNVNISEESRLIGVYDNKNSEVIMTILDSAPNTQFLAFVLGNYVSLRGDLTGKNLFIPNQTYYIDGGWFRFIEHTLYTLEFEYLHGDPILNSSIIDLSDHLVEKDNFTLAYNELIGAFTSFYSFVPEMYVKNDVGYFSTLHNIGLDESIDLWQHDVSEYYNYFYDQARPTTLSFIVNYGAQIAGEFTNIKFFSDIHDYEGNYLRNETISNIMVRDEYQQSKEVLLYPMTLPEDHVSFQRNTYETSALRIGRDWYAGIPNVNNENIIIFENQLYRSLIDNNLGSPTTNPGDFEICDLTNIRKTISQWATQIPRFNYPEADFDLYPEYQTSDRIRSDWAEVTLRLQDIVDRGTLREKNFKLSDIIVKSDVILL